MAHTNFSAVNAPNEVVMTCTIDAPRDRVFDAFTKEEHLSRWFGPHGFETTATSEPRTNGTFRIVMRATDALPAEFRGEYPMTGKYLEFSRPDRLVFTNDLSEHSEAWKADIKAKCGTGGVPAGDEALHSRATASFEDAGSGKTNVTLRSRFISDAVRDGYVKQGMNQGWSESFERLEAYVKEMR